MFFFRINPFLRRWTFYVFALLLASFWNPVKGQIQIITGISPNSASAGSTVNMTITGSFTNFTPATGITLYRPGWFFNASSYAVVNNTTMTAVFNLPTNAPLGSYSLFAGRAGSPFWAAVYQNGFNVTMPQGGNYGYVSGKVILDTNQNCVEDVGDTPAINKIIEILPGPYYASTDSNGAYGLWVPLGSYSVNLRIPPSLLYQCPISGSYPINLITPGDTISNLDYYLYQAPFSNLKITSHASPHRPGFRAFTRFTATNTSNQTISGYTLTANVSGLITHLREYPAPVNVTGNTTITWSIPILAPGLTATFTSYDSLPAAIPLGTILHHSAFLSPSDTFPADDNITGVRQVTGSYDPNDKQVWNADNDDADGFIEPSDSLLRYLIRFQNTGNDTAFNIFISDTLDTDLDVNSLQVLSASHNFQVTVSGPGYIQFTFPNILLVDSMTNEPKSHGYIEYTIERKANLPLGTSIDNTAHIYFDFNAPIVTNTVSSVICPKLGAGYQYSSSNQTLSFSDTSTGHIDQYLWNFGDGVTATASNPVHTYSFGGSYSVCLTVSNNCGRIDSVCQNIFVACAPPNANFSFSAVDTTVSFSDQSGGSPLSWLWDFGDGASSSQQNPIHNYNAAGNYNVCLIITSNCGDQDTTCQDLTITCPAPVAAFGSTAVDTTVSFSDQSSNNPLSWNWDFGDGNSSILQNPIHNYSAPGTYQVCLEVINSCGTRDTSCQTLTITCPAPVAAFGSTAVDTTLSFSDQSTNNPLSWNWDFGDGNGSSLQNPVHTYAAPGTYQVCLEVLNGCGTRDTSCQDLMVTCPSPAADFTFNGNFPTIAYSDLSNNNPGNWFWDFGDGNTSTLANPVHSYANQGNYTVCLSASNICGGDTICKSVSVLLGLNASLVTSFSLYPNPSTGIVNLNLSLLRTANLQIKVFDSFGHLVVQRSLGLQVGPTSSSIDLSDLPLGIYFFQINAGGDCFTRKVMRR